MKAALVAPRSLTDAEYVALAGFLAREAGLVFDDSRRAALSAIVFDRLAATGDLDRLPGGGPVEEFAQPGPGVRQTDHVHAMLPTRWMDIPIAQRTGQIQGHRAFCRTAMLSRFVYKVAPPPFQTFRDP